MDNNGNPVGSHTQLSLNCHWPPLETDMSKVREKANRIGEGARYLTTAPLKELIEKRENNEASK